jgi:hypothetical protein
LIIYLVVLLVRINFTNVGSGYTTIPTVTITGGGGVGAGLTITKMRVTDVTITNRGSGAPSTVPVASLVSSVGSGATVVASMGIGNAINIIGFGTGYNTAPSIGVTAVDGITGSGASVTTGLGYNF